MLLKLPKETILIVLNFLAFQDRLNLVKTCQHLRNVISESHLYEELPLLKDGSKVRKAINYFKKNPAYGSQVKRLKITRMLPGISNQLPSIFPNIKDFSFQDDKYNIEYPEFKFLLKWKDTLEVFPIMNELLLKHNTFSRISSLALILPSTFRRAYEKNRSNMPTNRDIDNISRVLDAPTDFNPLTNQLLNMNTQHNRNPTSTDLSFQFFDCFKNTPSLKHLQLIRGGLCIEYLEKLHTVCPQLTSLSLSSMHLYVGDTNALPSVIVPAKQILSLHLHNFNSDFNSQSGILEYLTEKYTKLTELLFLTSDCKLTGNHDESLRRKKEFLSSIPSTIKVLKLNTEVFNDPISILQDSVLDLTELDLYPADEDDKSTPTAVVTHPKHVDYLKSLNSLKTLNIKWNGLMENYRDGPISNSISHLTIQFTFDDMYNDTHSLDNILLLYPSLQSLIIHQKPMVRSKVITIPVTINDTFRNPIYPNLKRLTIEDDYIDQKMTHFVRAALPNLKELTLFCRLPDDDPDAFIGLDGCNFDVLDLMLLGQIPYVTHFTLHLQVKTLKGLKSYKFGLDYIFNSISIKKPRKNKKVMKMSTIICDDIRILKISGTDMKPFLVYSRIDK